MTETSGLRKGWNIFRTWLLDHPSTWRGRMRLVGWMLTVLLVWNVVVVGAMQTVLPRTPADAVINVVLSKLTFSQAIRMVSWGIIAEELLRLVPVAIAVWLLPKNIWLVICVAVGTAIGFGLLHLDNGLPLWLVLASQGVGGMLMTLVYLKGGGLTGKQHIGFLLSYGLHFAYDFILLAVTFGFP